MRKVSPTDAQFLLRVLWDECQSVFRMTLGQSERTFVSERRNDERDSTVLALSARIFACYRNVRAGGLEPPTSCLTRS